MTEYEVQIEERITRIVTIQAETEQDAVEKVRQQYRNEEIVLTPDECTDTEITVIGQVEVAKVLPDKKKNISPSKRKL